MNRKFLLAAFFVVVPLSAVHAMTVATFLQKAEALKARGITAMFSSDLSLLKNEVTGAAESLKAENAAARRAGRTPAFCAEGQRLGSNELLAYFNAMPPALRQRTEVRDALRAYMIRRYPCR